MDAEMLEEIKDALMEWCQDDEQAVSVYLDSIMEWRRDSYKLQKEMKRADKLQVRWDELLQTIELWNEMSISRGASSSGLIYSALLKRMHQLENKEDENE